MTRRTRTLLFLVSAAVFAGCFALACLRLPPFGTAEHPYGARAVAASLDRHTANVIASVTFDQRGLDTLGEEALLFAAVLGAVVLLRRARDEHTHDPEPVDVQPAIGLFGALSLPVTLLAGGYVVAHGQLTPGGGFQGGIVLATGLHLAYLAADYRVLKRVRPLAALHAADAIAAGAFVALGFTGLLAGAAYLENVLPLGTFGDLASGGLVPLLNAAVGVEVGSGIVVLLAHFLQQAHEMESRQASPGTPDDAHEKETGEAR
ncbi:MnhB domain-containing protein [Streptomyces sp. NPDC002564]|uniref:MnhB domain-containing protein n=1 Tax=Streptomyces sp. NPDC002564 TaxID=3364649 RepID=UPI0036B88139